MNIDELKEKILLIKKDAIANDVPIMKDDAILEIVKIIKDYNFKDILEIGMAVGYSTISYFLSGVDINVDSCERDSDRYLKAVSNIKMCELEDKINPIFKDAFDLYFDKKFDLIILDGAKGQNINFFEKFKHYLKEDGMIITDNMNFHGFLDKDESEITSRNLRGLIRKIKEYHTFLEENEEFETKIYNIGDGLAISKRK